MQNKSPARLKLKQGVIMDRWCFYGLGCSRKLDKEKEEHRKKRLSEHIPDTIKGQ